MNRITGRSAFLALLKDEGITHLFGNPGTTELPIMHALKDHPDLTYVMAMQESLVVAIADGYSRASGRLVACNVHVAPGLGNAMGSLYNAKFTGTPMILTAGQQEQGHGLMEPVLYRAAGADGRAAGEMGGRGDAAGGSAADRAPRRQDRDHAADRAGVHLAAGRYPQCRSRHRTRPFDPGRYAREALRRGVAGAGAAHPEGASGRSSSPAMRSSRAMRCRKPRRWRPRSAVRPISNRRLTARISCRKARASWARCRARRSRFARCLSPYDLMIVLGADPLRMSVYSEVDPLPEGMPIVQIGLVDWDLAKNYGAEIALKADVQGNPARADPGAEVRRRRRARGARQTGHRRAGVEELDRAARRSWSSRSRRPGDRSPIDPDWLALQVVEAMPDNAILVDEGLTSSRQITGAAPASRSLRLSCAGLGRHRLGLAGFGRRQPRQSRSAGGVFFRRRQRDVFDPGAVDRGASQAAADGRDRQQWRLPHHQAAAAGVPWRRPLCRHGFRRSAGGFRRASPNRSGWRRSGSPSPGS